MANAPVKPAPTAADTPETQPMVGSTPIIQPNQETPDPNLPPAGYRRNETLARNQDNLDQQIDRLEEARRLFKLDESKFDPDNEILQHMQRSGVNGRVLRKGGSYRG